MLKPKVIIYILNFCASEPTHMKKRHQMPRRSEGEVKGIPEEFGFCLI